MASLETNKALVLQLIEQKKPVNSRMMVAIAGPPGSGKSTLAEAVVDAINKGAPDPHYAALIPMDGFHLPNALLIERNQIKRKGAPETFDSAGLLQLLSIVSKATETVQYPIFDRAQDASIPNAATVKSTTKIIVVEGNYLLLNDDVWREVAALFEVTILLKPPIIEIENRLIQRWLTYDHSLEQAIERTRSNDLKNAHRVLNESLPADLVIQ